MLDNCEHVLDAAGEIVADVMRRCPGVKVLGTSREALGLAGERIVALRPLGRDDAVTLFHTQVDAHDGGFSLSGADRGLVQEVCERLDGLPLAIELAAARARSMPLVDVAARLGERFRLLRGQRRVTERHQTLRATVAWSYDLLTDAERQVSSACPPSPAGSR